MATKTKYDISKKRKRHIHRIRGCRSLNYSQYVKTKASTIIKNPVTSVGEITTHEILNLTVDGKTLTDKQIDQILNDIESQIKLYASFDNSAALDLMEEIRKLIEQIKNEEKEEKKHDK